MNRRPGLVAIMLARPGHLSASGTLLIFSTDLFYSNQGTLVIR